QGECLAHAVTGDAAADGIQPCCELVQPLAAGGGAGDARGFHVHDASAAPAAMRRASSASKSRRSKSGQVASRSAITISPLNGQLMPNAASFQRTPPARAGAWMSDIWYSTSVSSAR